MVTLDEWLEDLDAVDLCWDHVGDATDHKDLCENAAAEIRRLRRYISAIRFRSDMAIHNNAMVNPQEIIGILGGE